MVLAPPPLTATERTDVLLEFTVLSHPPSHTQYLHKGTTFIGEHDIVSVGVLLLKDVSKLNAGQYSLTASNELGNGYNHTTLDILCKWYSCYLYLTCKKYIRMPGTCLLSFLLTDAPDIVPHAGAVIAQIFMSIVLLCGESYSGNPMPQIMWTTNVSLLLDSRYHVNRTTGNLLISTVRYTDTGFYECSAQNSLGSSSAKVHLLVLGRSTLSICDSACENGP